MVEADFVIITVAVPIFQHRKIEIDFLSDERYKMFDAIHFVDFVNCWILFDEKDEKYFDENTFMYLPSR